MEVVEEAPESRSAKRHHRKVPAITSRVLPFAILSPFARRGVVVSGSHQQRTVRPYSLSLENVIQTVTPHRASPRRKTVTAMDVVYALKRFERFLYGFGG
jgi:histone H4